MSWADHAIEELEHGRTVWIRPSGHSMEPIVNHKDYVLVQPISIVDLSKGDVVLCKVGGNVYLHKVLAVKHGTVQIGNNRGHTNGWTAKVYGKMVKKQKEKP